MLTSLILTTKDEADSLPRLLDSISAQTRAPDEIVAVDGGSQDATVDVLHAGATRLPIVVLSHPGANISRGRNAAIRAASGSLICVTDAGVRLDPTWLAELTRPIERGDADVVSGFFVPDPRTVFETALAATTLPALEDIRPERFLPSSRSVAFRKDAWERVGGYPEWLDYCEDVVFDLALEAARLRFVFAPRAIAQFRPRRDLKAFFRQYYLYARGDGKANLWLTRHVVRYATYLLALPLLLALTLALPALALAAWLAAGIIMFFTPYRRLFPMLSSLAGPQKLLAILWVPVIRVVGDIAKMVGYPVGVVWRVTHPRVSASNLSAEENVRKHDPL